jgi:hypothetical protein
MAAVTLSDKPDRLSRLSHDKLPVKVPVVVVEVELVLVTTA